MPVPEILLQRGPVRLSLTDAIEKYQMLLIRRPVDSSELHRAHPLAELLAPTANHSAGVGVNSSRYHRLQLLKVGHERNKGRVGCSLMT